MYAPAEQIFYGDLGRDWTSVKRRLLSPYLFRHLHAKSVHQTSGFDDERIASEDSVEIA